MKITPFLFFIFCVSVAMAQERCPSGLSYLVNDEPPGCLTCGSTFIGNTVGYTIDSVLFDFPCGEIENSQWVSMVVNSGRKLEVAVGSTSCQNGKGLEAGIYDQDLNLVSNCGVTNTPNNVLILVAENLNSGEEVMNLDTLVVDETKTYCFGDEICFSVDANVPATSFTWQSFEGLELTSGGEAQDTFICFNITSLGGIVVFASNACQGWVLFGANSDYIDTEKLTFVDTVICSAECFYFRDSCYSEVGRHDIVVNDFMGSECNEMLIVNIEHIEVFPSPDVNCRFTGNDLFLEWSEPDGAEEYIISLNRDSITTTSENSILIENVQIAEPIIVKIQPTGSCSYLPAEINCTDSPSSTKNDYSSSKISIFPNPSNGIINIKTDLKIEEVEVFDLNGSLLQKEKTASFESKSRIPGIYFLKIKTSNGVALKRIILK